MRAKAPAASAASTAARATRRGARNAARTPRAISAGLVARSTSASPSIWASLGSGRGVQGCGLGDRLGLAGRVEEDRGYVNPGDAVDERVVALGDEREAPALDLVDQPHLPQRLRAVESLGEHARRQDPQLLHAARGGQRGVADVVAQVEVRVVDPLGPALAERDHAQLLAEAGHQVKARVDVVAQLVVGGGRPLEQGRGGDVHVGGASLEVQERRIEAGQAIGAHCADDRKPISSVSGVT